jgi:hypothetical protein
MTPVDDVHKPPTYGVEPTGGDSGNQPWQRDARDDLPVLEPAVGGGFDPVLS